MRNNTANFLIVIIGIVLFSSSSWIADKSVTTNTKSFLDVSGAIIIIGTMLVLFAIINITSIIFTKVFNENCSLKK